MKDLQDQLLNMREKSPLLSDNLGHKEQSGVGKNLRT